MLEIANMRNLQLVQVSQSKAIITGLDIDYTRYGYYIKRTTDSSLVFLRGADQPLTTNYGAVHIYKLNSNGTYSFLNQIRSPVVYDNDRFGNHFDISDDGNVLVVGDYHAGMSSNNRGGVYVYERTSESSWTLRQTIKSYEGDKYNTFGERVFLSRDGINIIVSSSGAGKTDWSGGAAYIYEKNNNNSFVFKKKMADDIGFTTNYRTVAASGNFELIANHGKFGSLVQTCLYAKTDDSSWVLLEKLRTGIFAYCTCLAISNDCSYMVFSDSQYKYSSTETNVGIVHIVKKTVSGSWELVKTITPEVKSKDLYYGWFAAFSDNNSELYLGGRPQTTTGFVDQYSNLGDSWTKTKTFSDYRTKPRHQFGFNFDLKHDSIAIGAPYYNTNAGEVYFYDL